MCVRFMKIVYLDENISYCRIISQDLSISFKSSRFVNDMLCLSLQSIQVYPIINSLILPYCTIYICVLLYILDHLVYMPYFLSVFLIDFYFYVEFSCFFLKLSLFLLPLIYLRIFYFVSLDFAGRLYLY